MTELGVLSPIHIEKLGHNNDEIRMRALKCICSKYRLNLVNTKNWENNKKLLEKLLDWFNFQNHSDEETVCGLILKICLCDEFENIVQSYGSERLLSRISTIESKAANNVTPIISKIKDEVLKAVRILENLSMSCISVKTPEKAESESFKFEAQSDRCSETKPRLLALPDIEPLLFLPWKNLIKTDDHLLESTYESLRYVDEVSTILESCQLFKDVILRDFPAEIFVQRPILFKTFLELLQSPVIEIRTAVLKCLNELVACLDSRIQMLTDFCMRGTRWHNIESDTEKNVADLRRQTFQLSLPEFLIALLKSQLQALAQSRTTRETYLQISIVVKAVNLLISTNCPIEPVIIEFETVILARSKNKGSMLEVLILLNVLLSHIQDPMSLTLGLREQIEKSLDDPATALFFPKLYAQLHALVSKFHQSTTCNRQELLRICKSMEETIAVQKMEVRFLHIKDISKYFEALEKSLPSLEFHRSEKLIGDFLRHGLVAKVPDDLEEKRKKLFLQLLSHGDENIKKIIYEKLEYLVCRAVGSKSPKKSGNMLLAFLFDPDIFKELTSYGLDCTSVKDNSEKIVLEMLSQNARESTESRKVADALHPSISILSAFSDQSSVLGQQIIRIFDPEVYDSTWLDLVHIVASNLRLLFSKDPFINEVAFERLRMLLKKDDPAKEKLPDIATIKGLRLSSLCVSVKPVEIRRFQSSFSTPRSLRECLTTLEDDSQNSHRRRSALSELENIITDRSLHELFLEENGVSLMISILNNSLIEKDYKDYPDSVMSVIKILKSLALNYLYVRLELSKESSILLNILRSLILFCADDSFRQDGVQLLFLLLFPNEVSQVDSEKSPPNNIFVSALLQKKIAVPFHAQSNAKISLNTLPSLRVELMGNPYSRRFFQVYWSCLWLGGVSEVLDLQPTDLSGDIHCPGLPDDMKLTAEDLRFLKKNSVAYMITRNLLAAKEANSHGKAVECIEKLQSYLLWLSLYKTIPVPEENPLLIHCTSLEKLDDFPWVSSFSRFLQMPPACMEDEALLNQLLDFFRLLIRVVDSPQVINSLSEIFTDRNGIMPGLLRFIDTTDRGIEGRESRQKIVLIAQDILSETCLPDNSSTWLPYVNLILDSLNDNARDYLANISNLDSLISLLCDITGAWTWDYGRHLDFYPILVTRVLELILEFQGFPDFHLAFMGVNIIKNALLVLVHLLFDGIISVKNWEKIWHNALKSAEKDCTWILLLMCHHDPMIRACALQFLGGFFTSACSLTLLVDDLNLEIATIWSKGFTILQDSCECALVREKAADLLAQLTLLGSSSSYPGASEFLNHLIRERFYNSMAVILSSNNKPGGTDLSKSVTTPGLSASICRLLYSISCLDPSAVVAEALKSDILLSILSIIGPASSLSAECLSLNEYAAKLIRTYIIVSAEARNLFLSSSKYLRLFSSLLDLSICDNGVISKKVERLWSEVMFLLVAVLEKQDGGFAVKKALAGLNMPSFLSAIHFALSTSDALRSPCLQLICNLAKKDLSYIFTIHVPGKDTFGMLVTEYFFTAELSDVAKAMSAVFLVSQNAQKYACQNGFANNVRSELRKIYLQLNERSIDDWRKPSMKKKIEPLLDAIETHSRMIANLCYRNANARFQIADTGVLEIYYKLWVWCSIRPTTLLTVIKMLCTVTYKSERACQSLAIVSPGQRRMAPGSNLLQCLIHLADTEMDVISKSRDLLLLSLVLQLLSNACTAVECRVILAKSGILAVVRKMSMARGKKLMCSLQVLNHWFEFFNVFAAYPEGQLSLCQDDDTLELIYLTVATAPTNLRTQALITLLNISLHSQNRIRFISNPAAILKLLLNVLQFEEEQHIEVAASILWALAANSQKGKLALRNAGCDLALTQALVHCKNAKCQNVMRRAIEIIGRK